jgi:alcohol dehydrogenase class IV
MMMAAIERTRRLLAEVEVSARLSAFGISRDIIPALAEKAMQDGCHQSDPRICTEADMVMLYEKAL